MVEISKRNISEEFPCPYISEQMARNEYFFGIELTELEMDDLLKEGWRKFGWYFFRPACKACKACIPLRVVINDFKPSRSQRKVLQKNSDITMKVSTLSYRDEIYELYTKHSHVRFDQKTDKNEFIESFFNPACPSLQTEYYLQDKLIAVGFLDLGVEGMSSVYFIYDTDYLDRSLGIYGTLQEIKLAKSLGFSYYYLGYWIQVNPSMRYKATFFPHETMNWQNYEWQRVEKYLT